VSSVHRTKDHLSAIHKFGVSPFWDNHSSIHQILSDGIQHTPGWCDVNPHNQNLGLERPQVEPHSERESRAVVIFRNCYDMPSMLVNIIQQLHVTQIVRLTELKVRETNGMRCHCQ